MAEDAVVIDIRRPDEWRRTGVIEGTHSMTFFDAEGNYDLRAWMSKLMPVAIRDQKIAIVCHSGGRSRPVSRFLHEDIGYRRVYNVRDGIAAWIAEGRPTVPHQLIADRHYQRADTRKKSAWSRGAVSRSPRLASSPAFASDSNVQRAPRRSLRPFSPARPTPA